VGVHASLVSVAGAVVGSRPALGGVRLPRHRLEPDLNYESPARPGSPVAGSVLNNILTAVNQTTGWQEALESGLSAAMLALTAECGVIHLGTGPEDLVLVACRDAPPLRLGEGGRRRLSTWPAWR
jgi:hypothetical protein